MTERIFGKNKTKEVEYFLVSLSPEYQKNLHLSEEFGRHNFNKDERLLLWESGEIKDRHKLALSMINMVIDIAKHKQESLPEIPIDDLIQAGIEGVYESFNDYMPDHESGSGVLTHAGWGAYGKMSVEINKEINERKRNLRWAFRNGTPGNRIKRPVEEEVEESYWEVIREKFMDFIKNFPDSEATIKLSEEIEAIEIKYFSDSERVLTNEEVGQIMNISHGTVSNLVRRGIVRSRKFLSDFLG